MALLEGLWTELRAALGNAPALRAERPCDEDVVSCVWEALRRLDVLESALETLSSASISGACPDRRRALEHKQAGNSAFRLGKLPEAAREYSLCLQWLSHAEDPLCAAQVYGNRALCALRMGELAQAEADATSALELRPTDKALFHRARGRGAQGRWEEALADCEEAARLSQVTEPQIGRFRDECAARLLEGAPESCAERTDESRQSALPEKRVAWRRAADASLGRELVTVNPEPQGTLLLEEAPLAWGLERTARRERCSGCGARLGGRAAESPCLATSLASGGSHLHAPFFESCPRCPLALYCSRACREADVFHRPDGVECGRPWPSVLGAAALVASRLVRAGETAHADPARADAPATLESGTRLFDPEERLLSAGVSLLCALVQLRHSPCGPEASSGSQKSCAPSRNSPLLLATKHYAALGTLRVNGFALHEPWNDGSSAPYGHAVYALASMANHSCAPTVAIHFEARAIEGERWFLIGNFCLWSIAADTEERLWAEYAFQVSILKCNDNLHPRPCRGPYFACTPRKTSTKALRPCGTAMEAALGP